MSADEWAVLSAVGLFRSVAPTRLATVLRVPPTRAALRARLRSGECLGRPVRYTHGRAGSSEDREGQVDRRRRYAVGRRLPRRELVGHELQRRRDRPGGSVHEPCSRSHRDRWHAGEPDGRLRLSVGGVRDGNGSVSHPDGDNTFTRVETGGEGPGSVEPVGDALWVSQPGSNSVVKIDPDTASNSPPSLSESHPSGPLTPATVRSSSRTPARTRSRGSIRRRIRSSRRSESAAAPSSSGARSGCALASAGRLTPLRPRRRLPRALGGSGARCLARARSPAG